MTPSSVLTGRLASALAALSVLVIFGACTLLKSIQPLPPLADQKARIMNGEFPRWELTSRAFIEEWGKPTYEHREVMQFFPVEDGDYVPRFRVPLGEPPRGWDSTVVMGEGHFLGYAERGELLGFLDDRLVYRERMSPEQIHAVGKVWQRESLFKAGPAVLPVPPR